MLETVTSRLRPREIGTLAIVLLVYGVLNAALIISRPTASSAYDRGDLYAFLMVNVPHRSTGIVQQPKTATVHLKTELVTAPPMPVLAPSPPRPVMAPVAMVKIPDQRTDPQFAQAMALCPPPPIILPKLTKPPREIPAMFLAKGHSENPIPYVPENQTQPVAQEFAAFVAPQPQELYPNAEYILEAHRLNADTTLDPSNPNKVLGFGEPLWGSICEMVWYESRWDPRAINPAGGACGAVQSWPCGKMRGVSMDEQILWSFKYIRVRYTDPAIAYQQWQQRNPHWY